MSLSSRRKLQVFISSTYNDLLDDRQAAVSAVLKTGHIPAGMELFNAGDQSQLETIKRWINESDIFMLIIVGLPASGKCFHARSLLAGRSHYEDIHHWLYYRDQHIRAGDDRFGRFLGDLQTRRPWVIDSVEMCERDVRERFVRDYLTGSGEVDWLFFENDPDQCRRNAQVPEQRGEGHRLHRLREIDRVTQVYDFPTDAYIRRVYRSCEQATALLDAETAAA